jgi:hypothetical protein
MNKECFLKQKTYAWLAFVFLTLTLAATAFRHSVETPYIFNTIAPIVFLLLFITCTTPVVKPSLPAKKFALSNIFCGLGGFVYLMEIYWSNAELIIGSFITISLVLSINSIVFLKIDRL